ncbi:PhnB protein [Loktanella atrilutea]|uniref:PhnB protein n=2 Tax=Loktanella atrilutea TaxID=366533 RepID=A0A1M4WK91_LOKAT|nr:PhnB protein [Loktanella atrilutea]
MGTMPYLHFRGDCAAALRFYADLMGGTDLQMMPYSASPDAPADWQASDRIMHGQVTLGDGVLMASDFPPGQAGDAQAAVSIMQTFDTEAQGRAVFDGLAAEGDVITPFGPTFFSPGFGMLRDRFGTHWIVTGGRAPQRQ